MADPKLTSEQIMRLKLEQHLYDTRNHFLKACQERIDGFIKHRPEREAPVSTQAAMEACIIMAKRYEYALRMNGMPVLATQLSINAANEMATDLLMQEEAAANSNTIVLAGDV